MEGDRIDTVFDLAYKATNSKGKVTLEITPTQLKVSDQSPESASAHLAAVVMGLMAPATKQANID